MTNAQEPAFPQSGIERVINEKGQVVGGSQFNGGGITKLEYFIAQAPAVPEWFKPDMDPCPDRLTRLYAQFNSEKEQELLKKYFDNEDNVFVDPDNPMIPADFKEAVLEHIAASEKNNKEIEKWEADEAIQTIIQWRYYYAQEQLKLIEKLSDLNSDEWIKK